MKIQSQKLFVFAVVAGTLTLAPLTTYGQVTPRNSPTEDSGATTVVEDRTVGDDTHDYSWIGLLGLLGLAGLIRRRSPSLDYDRTGERPRATVAGREIV